MATKIGIAAGMFTAANRVPDELPGLVDYITFGSFTLKPNDDAANAAYWYDSRTKSSLSDISFRNPGLSHFLDHDLTALADIKRQGCSVRLSLAPRTPGELNSMMGLLWHHAPRVLSVIDEIEISAYSNNGTGDADHPHTSFMRDPFALRELMGEGGHLPLPTAIKIGPALDDTILKELVRLALLNRYTAIVSGGALMVSSKTGGITHFPFPKGRLGGALLLDEAVGQVTRLRALLDAAVTAHPKPSIIGGGGVMSAADAKRFNDAGATGGVQLATYLIEYGIDGVKELTAQLQ